MRREQNTGKPGWSREGTMEAESSGVARSAVGQESVKEDGASAILERILQRKNLNAAYERVKRNGGAAGIDGMRVDEMLAYLKEHGRELVESIREGTYRPQPVRRVEIPKPDGGIRLLGVPTVIDRMVQQAVVQILQPIFERTFSESSYGFRPNRDAHQAIRKAREYCEVGYTRIVDIDLAKYFDTVNHGLLLGFVREQIEDEAVINLIRKFLRSGVMVDGLVSQTTKGTPQGGNLSPLLSNIYLTKFDRMLESRGLKFARYADDCNIYVRTARAAERVMANCVEFLEGKLKLKVNREKSQCGSPFALKFLGFSLYKTGSGVGIRAHGKSLKRFKERICELTSRKQGKSIGAILAKLKQYTMGWLGYYATADMKNRVKELNEWTRRRIRQIYWKQWKRIKARHDNLVKLGVSDSQAWQWANSRLGYWRVAGSWILSTTLTNNFLASAGYDDIFVRYEALHLTR